jgi:hypothetical protein
MWCHHRKSHRQLLGTGTVKGGKHKIRIKTTNGDVRIIKK